jgi:dUTP pyrophosphatase
MKVSIKLDGSAKIPEYANIGDSGADLYAAVPNDVLLFPDERMAVPTGLRVALPHGFELQVRSRSGLALNYGIVVANSPGTVDSGYRGEIKVILINLGDEPFIIKPGMRIAQAVLAPVARAEFVIVDELPESDRGDGGFGSSGL